MTACLEFLYEGLLDTGLLWEAFSLLRQEFPALTGRVETAAGGLEFVVDGHEVAREEVFRVRAVSGGKPDPTPLEIDIAKALAMIEVVSGDCWHRVMFAMSHALADGTHIIAMYARLWEKYTSLVESAQAEIAPSQSFPLSPQAVLESRGIRKGPSTGSERVSRVAWSGEMPSAEDLIDGKMRAVYQKLSLDPELTAMLQTKAKSEGMSLYSALVGAILLAERDAFGEATAEDELTLGLMSLVDGRRRLSPPVGDFEVTNFVGASYIAMDVSRKSDPIDLGKRMHEQIRQDIASGLYLQPMLTQIDIREPREPSIVCSNLGVIPDLSLPTKLTLQDFTPYIYYEILGEDFNLSDRVRKIRAPSLTASVYQIWRLKGRLQINMINLSGTISDKTRKGILDNIEQTCRKLVE
ncbi:hypothetical protein Srot_2530 [Segniliparus rotundus DSM 44985]|uniref:Phthiocerol/phthiodiolone dimycocerosyl transferase n=2 Tax=Segniliparus rotundus TaxID=286802 RepID=D6ZBL5_SEGRD|nr:hypothetical protein Srot_2530 [Segniliparus rotundus DSM 44985]